MHLTMIASIKLYSLLILFNIILDSCCSASNEKMLRFRRYDYSNWHCCQYSYTPAASSFTSGGGGGFNGNGGGGIQSVVNVSPYGGISTTFTAGGGGGGSGAGFQRVTGPGGTVVVAAGGGGFGNGYGYGYAWGRRI